MPTRVPKLLQPWKSYGTSGGAGFHALKGGVWVRDVALAYVFVLIRSAHCGRKPCTTQVAQKV